MPPTGMGDVRAVGVEHDEDDDLWRLSVKRDITDSGRDIGLIRFFR